MQMSQERVQYEGRLALNRRERSEIQLCLQGKVRSLRMLLDLILPVEQLEGEMIASQATELATLLITYREKLAEAQTINSLLGR